MSSKLKRILYIILPIFFLVVTGAMITYIFAATRASFDMNNNVAYVVPIGSGTASDPYLIYGIGSNTSNAERGTFNFYAGKNKDGRNYFASTSPQYYFKQVYDFSGTEFIQIDLIYIHFF